MMERSLRGVVAVAGGTCAGKTILASHLSRLFRPKVTIVPQDAFYPDRSRLSAPELSLIIWDSLDSIDSGELLRCLIDLGTSGMTVVPRYDNKSHARTGYLVVRTTDVVVLEGLHAITVAGMLEGHVAVPTLKVFIDCEDATRKARRTKREASGATVPGEFEAYWTTHCQPVFHAEIAQQRVEADVILDGAALQRSSASVEGWIATLIDDERDETG